MARSYTRCSGYAAAFTNIILVLIHLPGNVFGQSGRELMFADAGALKSLLLRFKTRHIPCVACPASAFISLFLLQTTSPDASSAAWQQNVLSYDFAHLFKRSKT